MGEESWRLTHDCENVLELPSLPGECVDDEVTTYIPQLSPNTLPAWFLPQECPSVSQADRFPAQSDPSLTQASPSHTQTGPSYTQIGPSHTQAGPSSTKTGPYNPQKMLEFTFDDEFCPSKLDRYIDSTSPFSYLKLLFGNDLYPELDSPINVASPSSDECPSHTQADPFLTQSNPSLTQASVFLTHAGPSNTQAGPSHTQAGPSHTQAGPSHTQAGPSHIEPGPYNPQNMLEFAYDDDFCQSELDRYMESTSPCSDLKFSFNDDLFSELDSPIDVTTPLSDAGPSDARPDQEWSTSFTQSRTCPTQTGTSQIQAGPNKTQRRPSHTKEMIEFKPNQCTYCKKVFVKKGNLRKHIHNEHKHDDAPSFLECILCKKSFLYNKNLRRHIQQTHSNRKLEFECSKCGKTFTSRFSLTRHSQRFCRPLGERCLPTADEPATINEGSSHTETDPSLTQLGSSQTQIGPSHSQAGPCQTEEKRAGYSQKQHNIAMETSNTKCIFCKKDFSTKGNLKRHINTEHADNPIFFTCNHCGKDFLRRDFLKEHIRTRHTKLKSEIECSKCGKLFSASRSLARHSKSTCPSLRNRPVSAEDDSAVVDEDVDTPELSHLTHVVEPGTSTGRSEQPSNPEKGCKRYECPNCGCKYTGRKDLLAHLRLKCGIPP